MFLVATSDVFFLCGERLGGVLERWSLEGRGVPTTGFCLWQVEPPAVRELERPTLLDSHIASIATPFMTLLCQHEGGQGPRLAEDNWKSHAV